MKSPDVVRGEEFRFECVAPVSRRSCDMGDGRSGGVAGFHERQYTRPA